jgi:hypothetical protein
MFIYFRAVFYRSMRCRYIIFYVITSIFTMAFLYYIMAFCAIYRTASISWLISAIVNILLSWGFFQFLKPVSSGMVRGIIREKPDFQYYFLII